MKLNYDIEWLFKKVYNLQSKSPMPSLGFLSDWDCYSESDQELVEIVNSTFDAAKEKTEKYLFPYEQLQLKEQIRGFLETSYHLHYKDDDLTISPSSTVSISLVTSALHLLGCKRLLVITPAYFSLLTNIKKLPFEIVYHHLFNREGFDLRLGQLETLVVEQYIDAVFLTDPVYSTGVDFIESSYARLVDICNKNHSWLIVDHSLGGLNWNGGNKLMPAGKMKVLAGCEKYCFIDSLSKRLLINGIKFSTIFGSAAIIDGIDRTSDSLYGALNSVQTEFMRKIFTSEGENVVVQRINRSVADLKSNFELMKSVVADSDYLLPPVNCGYFTYLFHKDKRIRHIDTEKYLDFLLAQLHIVGLTNDRLGYFEDNNLGLRVNLSLPCSKLARLLRDVSRLPLHSFHKG
ncbi:MAG TPA: pyridoxal phosphate-dependent aminotransferase [Puia sp.]|uniref:pyridoxal phosphate-dependent aminotransferase n=1 Tax=Puia sp. TaxID=2045100 RepID=UPI002D036C37|nr:pyridoxal phosphate-dependent aminotransferase [Puia sp.]HVU98512.1 pyridoxal phosphate-dependent aminotransferase [Puia sp.]